MRKLAMRGLLTAALCAGLATAARAADDGAAPPAPTGMSAWWNGLFGSPEKPVEKPVEKAEKKKVEPAAKPALDRAALGKREWDNYFRRLDVCKRLREVAVQKDDEDMLRRIDELEEQINKLYLERTMGAGTSDLEEEAPRERAKPNGTRASTRNRSNEEDDQ